MAGRALWKAYFNFDGTEVPVKFHTAVRDLRLHFNLLHRKDGERLKQMMVCPVEEAPVPDEEIVKGYELSDDEWVIVEPDELEALAPEFDREIEILDFVPLDSIDPRYFSRSYWIGPDGKGEVYSSLAKALEKSGQAAICRWAMRKKSYIGALKIVGGVLLMETMHYHDEVVPVKALELSQTGISDRERKTAVQLIEAMSTDFKPENYQNEYQEELRKLIDKKAKGEKITLKKPKKKKATEEEDLADVLEASLAQVKK